MTRSLQSSLRLAGTGLLAFAAAVGLGVSASADHVIIANGHWDIAAEFHDDELELGWHNDDEGIELDAADALLFVNPDLTTYNRPAGSQWDFLGATAGSPVYILTSSLPPGQTLDDAILLGLSSEEILPGLFDPDLITFRLVGFSGPGDFSLYSLPGGTPTVHMATSDGVAGSTDFFNQPVGGHRDLNFAFSELGLYSLTLQAEGTLLDGTMISSARTTFYFGVGTTAIPEPASIAMAGMGVLAVGGLAVRRRRKEQETV